ncbi:hypothetical protein RN001_006194 [Aquatica leii]|uniref:Uncharacterized protein n=1 Tax=Aquatica leii TaxID=1421715 RepID=A0AAN7Q8N5_9COLE|nr:hypothetical protein RN001_006194 [Aquatica leii]
MNHFLALTIFIATATAQRPSYLGGPTYPQLANRFKTDNDETSTVNVINRLGESGGTTEKIPVDARGDEELVKRIKTWPRENIPFWVLNADQIEKHRNPQGNQQAVRTQGTQSRFGAQQNNLQDRFYDPYQDDFWYNYYYRPRPRFNSFESDTMTRTIRPIQTRGSFAGPL